MTANIDEKRHMGLVAALGCCICAARAEVHHIRDGMGMGMRNSHFRTIPLCYNHHRGRDGIHKLGERVWENNHGAEREWLEWTLKELGLSSAAVAATA